MKYFVLIPDGAADEPQESLGGKSPLEYASIPSLDELARQGRVGLTNHVPDTFNPGSEVACMKSHGIRPGKYFTGRLAWVEAAAKGIVLGPEDWAIRCNLVTIEDHGDGPVILHSRSHHNGRIGSST